MGIIGSSIKPFTTQSYKAGKFVEVSDADVKGKWGVFFFYPADWTFVCPTELEDLADQYADLQAMGVEVFAVSTDTHFSHKSWHDSSPAISKINYHMLGDQNHVISNNFGVLREGQGLADRATFVVDPNAALSRTLIRTSGETRTSNFLPWQAAYAEFEFTQTLWPDFTPDELALILKRFGNRDRRFGGVARA